MWCSTSRAVRVMAGRIARLGLSRHPGLLFRVNHEGYRDFAFGALAGPTIGASHLFHELAHAAELGGDAFERRVTAYGYGFEIPQVWVYDRFCSEPKTMQATARELRTFAHQYHLMQKAGYRLVREPFAADTAKIMAYMEDCYCVPGKEPEGRAAYCTTQILSHIEEFQADDSLKRLIDCLDRTRDKLKALDKEGPAGLYSKARRYRADGSLYSH